MSLRIEPAELLVVVGEIASGKSSLLSALCGEMYLRSGTMSKRNDRTILVPQHPFILNTSVRENITFGLPFDANVFKSVVAACALERDVDSMPGGIMTEIGERGITLSGGQRQRVGLARGVYAAVASKDPTILLCDDVLSALDASVASDVFSGVFSRSKGILRNRRDISVVLATHATWCVQSADCVLLRARSGRYGAVAEKLESFLQQ